MTFATLILLSQATTGDASIPQAITGGSVALNVILAGVLNWLLWIHLPNKDKQMKDLVDSKDIQMTNLLKRHDDLMKEKDERVERKLSAQQKVFETTLAVITDHCKEEMREIKGWSLLKQGSHETIVLPPTPAIPSAPQSSRRNRGQNQTGTEQPEQQ